MRHIVKLQEAWEILYGISEEIPEVNDALDVLNLIKDDQGEAMVSWEPENAPLETIIKGRSSARLLNALKAAQVADVRALSRMRRAEVEALPGVGTKGLRVIADALEEKGGRLR